MFTCRTFLCVLLSLTIIVVGHSLGVSSAVAEQMNLQVCETEGDVPLQTIEARLKRLEKLIVATEEQMDNAQQKADAGGPSGASESKIKSWFKGHEKRMAAWRSALEVYREEQRCWQERLLRGGSLAADEPSSDAPPEPGMPNAGAPVPAPPQPQPGQPPPGAAPGQRSGPEQGPAEPDTVPDEPVPSAGESSDSGASQSGGDQTTPDSQEIDPSDWDCENIRVRYIADRCTKWDSRYAEPCLATERGVYGWPPIFADWVVGVVWPEGVEELWGRGSWSGAHVTMESDLTNTPDDTPGENRLYDRQRYAWAERIFGPNGRVISLDEEGWPVVSVLGSQSRSRVPDQDEADQEEQPTAPPRVTLNGWPEFEHQFFVDDDGTFELHVKNMAPAPIYDPCRKETPTETSIFVQISFPGPQEFIHPIEPSSFTLQPQEERTIQGVLVRFFPELRLHETDILFGTAIQVQVREEGASGNLLFDRSFNVYRLFDVADKEHGDGIISMARTLADGDSHVVRTRPLELRVEEESTVELEAMDTRDFSTSFEGRTAFVFDPVMRDKRTECQASVSIMTTAGEPVGTLEIRGVAEPKNKIVFNSDGLEEALARIMSLAQADEMAQLNPPSYEVHPALITGTEVEAFDTMDERLDLAAEAERRLELLYEDVLTGIFLTSVPESDNAVKINWELRENYRPAPPPWRPFPLGKAFVSLEDPNKIDNLSEIESIVDGKMQWNRAELAFRLSEAINPNLRKDIYLYPDSMMESHKGFGDNTLTLTQQQMINALAKTAVHEISHTMSMIHPAQVGIREAISREFQRLQIADHMTDQTTFRFSFNGVQTGDLRFGDKIKAPLVALRSIGVENYDKNLDYGVMVYKCSRVPFLSMPPKTEKAVTEGCRGLSASESDRTFILEFINHLGGVDLDLVKIHPPTAGTVSNVEGYEKGETSVHLRKSEHTGVEAIIDLPGYTERYIKSDIMYGGFNDINGELRFLPGVSLEILEMALAHNYTLDDVDKVVALYEAYFEKVGQFYGEF